jgi:UDP-N-acetylglucosamine 2-epimerase (non-hydrolysing)
LKNVKVVDPLPHNELMEILIKSSLVISDSGGLQEECSFLKKKILVCRKVTERIESLNETSFLCKVPSELAESFKQHIKKPQVNSKSRYGDGNAAPKIVDILEKYVYFC